MIQHAQTQAYLRDHFGDDIAFMTKFFGSNQGLDELRSQPATLLVHDGTTERALRALQRPNVVKPYDNLADLFVTHNAAPLSSSPRAR